MHNDSRKEIKNLSLNSTEELIKKISGKIINPLFYGTDAHLEEVLNLRCRLINEQIKFSPEMITQIERVNSLLTESREQVWQKMRCLSRQMLQLRESGEDDFLDDFEIEGSVSIEFNGESSISPQKKDENNGVSDYVEMARILHDYALTSTIIYPSLFYFGKDANWNASDEELCMIYHKPRIRALPRYFDLPELKHIDFCEDLLILVNSSLYSISDIIRINDIQKEVKVNWISSHNSQIDNETSCLFFAGPVLLADKLSNKSKTRANETKKFEL